MVKFWNWFLSSFNHNYMDKPDFTKISAFALTLALIFCAIWITVSTKVTEKINTDSALYWLCAGITLFVGGHVAPHLTKSGTELKGKELDAMNDGSNINDKTTDTTKTPEENKS